MAGFDIITAAFFGQIKSLLTYFLPIIKICPQRWHHEKEEQKATATSVPLPNPLPKTGWYFSSFLKILLRLPDTRILLNAAAAWAYKYYLISRNNFHCPDFVQSP